MLPTMSSLEETAERFRTSPELIWNMSLQFNNLLQPEIGENGLIAYSDQHRLIIGRIIKLREQGMTDREITLSFDVTEKAIPAAKTDKPRCPSSDICNKNFKLLSDQLKIMCKRFCQLQREIETLKQAQREPNSSALIEKLPANQPYHSPGRFLD